MNSIASVLCGTRPWSADPILPFAQNELMIRAMSDKDQKPKGPNLEDLPDEGEPSISDAQINKRKSAAQDQKATETDFEDLDSLTDDNEDSGEGEASIEDLDKQLMEAAPELAAVQAGNFSELDISDEKPGKKGAAKIAKGLGKVSLLKNIDRRQKLLLGSIVGILVIFVPLFMATISGDLLPGFKIPYHLTLEELSDDVRSYDASKAMVPLFDSFRTKAITLTLPQQVISLKPKDGRPSFGRFVFSLSVRDDEYAKVIEQQKATVIDLIQRTLEEITWDALQSPIGKEKAKKIIRYRLNEALQGEVVVGVYYKSIILTK